MAALDEERMEIAKAAGYDVLPVLELTKGLYGDTKSENLEEIRGEPRHFQQNCSFFFAGTIEELYFIFFRRNA